MKLRGPPSSFACVRAPRLMVTARLYRVCASSRNAIRWLIGGAEEARTPDPLLAKEVLSQLSYGPSTRPALPERSAGGAFWTRTRDLSLIRTAL